MEELGERSLLVNLESPSGKQGKIFEMLWTLALRDHGLELLRNKLLQDWKGLAKDTSTEFKVLRGRQRCLSYVTIKNILIHDKNPF